MAGSFPRLLADIGGTSARFALQREADGPIGDVAVLVTADHPSLLEAARSYLAGLKDRPKPAWAAIGIATPITGDHVAMTNHPAWAFSIAELKRELQFDRLLVLNDFTTLALSLPVLKPEDLRQVGGSRPVEGAPIALIGPGTGLGAGGLMAASHHCGATPIAGEGGHVTLAACDDEEAEVIELLRQRFGHASAERAVSGQGIENLYQACCARAGVKPQAFEAADISARAIDGSDAQCVEAIALFFSFLGTTAGNLALTLGAHGGVYIGGGITAKLGALIEGSKLRERFEAKGRFRDYLAKIPMFVIDAKFPPALTGAARAFDALD